MFTSVLALGPAKLSGIILVLTFLFYAVQRTIYDYRIRRTGGVRAPMLANNPLFGKKLSCHDKMPCSL